MAQHLSKETISVCHLPAFMLQPSVLAKALHGDLNNNWINIRGPGHGAGDRSLGFCFDKNAPDGIRVKSFSGDNPDACRAHIHALLASIAVGHSISLEPGIAPDVLEKKRVGWALSLFDDAEPIKGTIAEKYLLSRGIQLSPSVLARDVLRFHRQTPFGKGPRVPALLALMTDIITNEPTGIQRTALTDDGSGKRPMPDGGAAKRMLGTAHRSAVMLEPWGTILAIAEGVETALSASKIFQMPIIAALSTSGIVHFPIIHGVPRLKIFADNDEPGLEAARACGRRYLNAGIDGEVIAPPCLGDDWNDVLMEQFNDQS